MRNYGWGKDFEEEERQSKKKQKKASSKKMYSFQSQLCQRYLKRDPTVGTLGETLKIFDYYMTYTTSKIECLLVGNYGQGEEFKKEDRWGKKQQENSAYVNIIDGVFEKVEANTIIDLHEGDSALGVLNYRQPSDS